MIMAYTVASYLDGLGRKGFMGVYWAFLFLISALLYRFTGNSGTAGSGNIGVYHNLPRRRPIVIIVRPCVLL
ncbi:hypothetical protein G7K_5827-t1 [Saitoella complicata NRRL Y-17804]|uniref:Uncharacterized protein n=1 Tax=Saitoella complicata (strain BCRC 22490 / CBS 7301 / JCM 7358 / NBRC 10748 / NRRL Y-17804) TaxID=698492 RepID=A0A0E9NPH3_SAICN|nr:hypothetical protein G7K_5827-t1 [Saitoella complicata NRRL Y-17804]